MPRTGLLTLVLAILVAASAPASPQDPSADPADEAAAELARAEEDAREGRYARAVDTYERIAERWPQTDAGRVAARRAEPNALLGWSDVLRHGPSSNRVDIVLMGDGYKLKQQSEFDDIANDIPREFERNVVFGEYFSYLNFVRASVRSEESGSDGWGREVSTALDGRVLEQTNAGNVVVSQTRVREVLEQLPEQDDLAIAIVQRGSAGTGRPGLAVVGGRDFRSLLHEWGHAFANLADEYSVDNGLESSYSREAANISLVDDPKAAPWAHWIEANAPGIGLYGGGLGRLKGVWHPQASGCIMNEGEKFYCAVCREALVLALYERVDPIESFVLVGEEALELAGPLRRAEPFALEVAVMRPEKHTLEVSWWLLPEAQAPPPARLDAQPRSARGPLVPIEAKPEHVSRGNKKGVHRFTVRPGDLEAGRYRLLCRVRDTTELRGAKLPWVLADPAGLLESERSVLIEVPAD